MRLKEAKKILPKTEFSAFESILMNQTSRTAPKKLMHRATLSRKLRDKYRDMAHRQAAEAKTRRTNTTDTRLNERKAQIFQDIIQYLEAELERPREKNLRGSKTRTKNRGGSTAKVRHRDKDKMDKEVQRNLLLARRR